MIAGVGIDVVSVSRLQEKLKSEAFKTKVFSEREQEYCKSATNSEQHYAVRFAAKEAFLKATCKGLNAGFDLNLIEVTHDALGKPQIELYESFKELMSKEGWISIHVSLSHEGDVATAIVMIER